MEHTLEAYPKNIINNEEIDIINGKKLKYYLIHNQDKERENIMNNEFNKWKFNINNINWVKSPNKDEMSEELINNIIISEPSYCCNIMIDPNRTKSHRGLISCTFKHYLSLKDIVNKNYDYGVIIEDNIYFSGDIPILLKKYIEQLDSLYENWDILFDRNWNKYTESPTNPNILVYPKSNEIKYNNKGDPISHGGTKAATFYLIKKECARILVENYLPFNNSPDWWMNDLFRKFNIKSFWVEPPMVNYPNRSNHHSTCK
jgi:GR25 family glycosyltransferase involved in LPS biosynthesis